MVCMTDMAAVESSATEVKAAAMADMVLDASSDADIIMSYLKKLQDQLSSTHKDAQRVAAFRAVLEIEHVPSAMLADATEEVSQHQKSWHPLLSSSWGRLSWLTLKPRLGYPNIYPLLPCTILTKETTTKSASMPAPGPMRACCSLACMQSPA